MSGKVSLFVLAALAMGILTGNAVFATSPEVGEPRPVQHGAADLLNNSSWNQVSYLAHEWWLGHFFGPVHIENLGSSNKSREIMFVGELGLENVVIDASEPTYALDWLDENLVDSLFAYRLTEDGHLVYCLDKGMTLRVFCQFNVFAQDRLDHDSVIKMAGVDLGPLGVAVVETSLLERLLEFQALRHANGEGLPK